MEFAFSSAQELFNAAHEAASDLNRITERLNRPNVSGIDYSKDIVSTSPTDGQDAIIAAIEDAADFISRADEDRACMDFCLKVLYGIERGGGVAALLSYTHADVCAWHYVGLESWSCVAGKAHMSERTARRYASEACDMIDARGMVNTIHGLGMAEL